MTATSTKHGDRVGPPRGFSRMRSAAGRRWLGRSRTVLVACACALLIAGIAPSGTAVAEAHRFRANPSEVLAWNQIAVRTELASNTTIQEGIIHLAYVQAAVFDAVDALDGGFRPYTGDLHARGRTDGDAAVAAAAHRILVTQYPAQASSLDADYATALAAIRNGLAKTRGIALGEHAAADLLDARANDGLYANVPYTFGSGPGVWVLPTDNPATTPATPWVAKMRPFIMRADDQFRPGPPPPLTSADYTAAYNETRDYGSATSTVRTPAETVTALFWGLGRPDAQYNEGMRGIVTSAGMDRVRAARALALTNLVASDAYIACFDAKYTYSFWRPYTAIRAGDSDGNPATIADPTWTPLVRTPNHPEYPANHGCVTSSFATLIDHLLGPDNFSLTVNGFPASAELRHYTNSSQLKTEIANVRVWDGVHFRFSVNVGIGMGTAVANYDVRHGLQQDDD
jgi:hypothetical protein